MVFDCVYVNGHALFSRPEGFGQAGPRRSPSTRLPISLLPQEKLDGRHRHREDPERHHDKLPPEAQSGVPLTRLRRERGEVLADLKPSRGYGAASPAGCSRRSVSSVSASWAHEPAAA